MTYFLPGLLVGFALATFAWGALLYLVLQHRPRSQTPTLRRRNRDRPIPEVPVPWEREEGIDYKWINLTGEER